MSDTCKSCNAPIEWALTENGHRIPLDVGIVDNGNIELGDDGIARYIAPGPPARRTHFSSCPDAQKHRRRRSKAKPLRDRYTP